MITMEEMIKMSVNYGLGLVLSIAMAITLWKLLVKVLEQGAAREERYARLVETTLVQLTDRLHELSKAVMLHDSNEVEFVRYIKSANDFQRQEHKDMIESLIEIREHNK